MSATFGLATPDDDAAIRSLLVRNPVPGRITLSYTREPDYFAGCGPMGAFHQVLVAKENDEVVGLACRAVRPMFINGETEQVGYLGQLRVDAAHRGRSLVSRGFRFFRQLHEDGRTPAYVTTIIEGNDEATGVLVDHPRPGMPRYRFVDRLHTLALTSRRVSRKNRLPASQASSVDIAELVAFLNEHGRRRQFFPAVAAEDFGTPVMRALDVADFFVLRDGRSMLGVCALWNQSSYKQTIVSGYRAITSALRPLYNAAARVTGRPLLPPIGSKIRTAYASFFCTIDDGRDTVESLIDEVLAAAAFRQIDYVILGFARQDPRLETAKRYRHVDYCSNIYTVAWEDGRDFHGRLDSRPAYLDPATL